MAITEYLMAVVLLAWALVELWAAENGSPYSTEKVLQVVSSHLLDKAACTVTDTIRWILFLKLLNFVRIKFLSTITLLNPHASPFPPLHSCRFSICYSNLYSIT